MTDLDALVARQLEEQPRVAVPPITVVRRRAARRRRARAARAAVLAAAAVGAAVVVVPSLRGGQPVDTVAVAPTGPTVAADVVQVSVCQAWPYRGGRRHCGTGGPELAARLAAVVRASQPAGEQDCPAADPAIPNVRISFAHADGRRSDVRVVDCLLTAMQEPEQPAAYAPELARLAGEHLTDTLLPADGSDREGCAAVVEDLAAFSAARHPSSDGTADAALLAQVLELTITEERAWLSADERAVVEPLYPRLNDWLLGYEADQAVAVFEQGLADLRATCPEAP